MLVICKMRSNHGLDRGIKQRSGSHGNNVIQASTGPSEMMKVSAKTLRTMLKLSALACRVEHASGGHAVCEVYMLHAGLFPGPMTNTVLVVPPVNSY